MNSEVDLYLGLRAASHQALQLEGRAWKYHFRGSDAHWPRPSLPKKLDAHSAVEEAIRPGSVETSTERLFIQEHTFFIILSISPNPSANDQVACRRFDSDPVE